MTEHRRPFATLRVTKKGRRFFAKTAQNDRGRKRRRCFASLNMTRKMLGMTKSEGILRKDDSK